MMAFPIRFEPRILPALIVSSFLIAVAIIMILKQWWASRHLNNNHNIDEQTYEHSMRQIRRRITVGCLMFGIGTLITLGDQAERFFAVNPGLFCAYWIGVLMLVGAMIVIAILDLGSTIAFAGSSRVRLGAERRAIEEELRRYRAERIVRAAQDPGNN